MSLSEKGIQGMDALFLFWVRGKAEVRDEECYRSF